jgi:class 3 adenylate cyclase
MPLEKRLSRMDFILETKKIIDETTEELVVEVRLIPNPERYDFKIINGEKGYYDRFDNVFIPLEELKKAAPQLEGMPIYCATPKIACADQYISDRIPYMRRFFENRVEDYKFEDASEDFLKGLERDKLRFVILLIDLKGSTEMSQQLPSETNAQIISLYQREMALIVEKFNGYVLKYLGDGLIAYFPEPNLIGMTDNALDCAATMKKMILFGITPVLNDGRLPTLNFRIGLDSGEAIVTTIGAERVKIHKDLIGETVNLSKKIQNSANINQILMGESTALSLHTFWRQRIQKVDLPKWDYKNRATGEVYPIYSLLENWQART